MKHKNLAEGKYRCMTNTHGITSKVGNLTIHYSLEPVSTGGFICPFDLEPCRRESCASGICDEFSDTSLAPQMCHTRAV